MVLRSQRAIGKLTLAAATHCLRVVAVLQVPRTVPESGAFPENAMVPAIRRTPAYSVAGKHIAIVPFPRDIAPEHFVEDA
jgi:hypothetical protein